MIIYVCVCVLAGHSYEQRVDFVNAEEEEVHFSVLQMSLLSEDQQSSLVVQPMNGSVAPKNRLITCIWYKNIYIYFFVKIILCNTPVLTKSVCESCCELFGIG